VQSRENGVNQGIK